VTSALGALAAAVAALVDDHDTIGMLTQLSLDLVEVTGAEGAGLMVVNAGGRLEVLATSSHQARELDLYELQTGEGPCVDAQRTGHVVHEESDAITARWPAFGPRLIDTGSLAVHAAPMVWQGRLIGALNVFLPGPVGLDEDLTTTVQAFADIGTIALIQAGLPSVDVAGLTHAALEKRTIIEQAKGVLAVTHEVDPAEAFDLLLAQAGHDRRRLDVVAAQTIHAASRRTTH
jgi:ANTAR domain-containing protein/GAF domain-containing protein